MNEKLFKLTWNHKSDSILDSVILNGKVWADMGGEETVHEAIKLLNSLFAKDGGSSILSLAKTLAKMDATALHIANLAYGCGLAMGEQSPEDAGPKVAACAAAFAPLSGQADAPAEQISYTYECRD